MDKYLVYGNPIKQSRSPVIHQAFAKQTEQNISYQKLQPEIDGFKEAVNAFIALGGKGANVTAPFKEQALEMCHHLSQRAQQAGAVNTLSFINNEIYGDNTDGLGLVQDLLRHGVKLTNAKVLILGAGGAVKGVILPLLEQQLGALVIANRTVSKAQALCQQFGSDKMQGCGFDDIANIDFDVIINATSASLTGEQPPISDELISDHTVCYDMVYGKSLTPFLMWAERLGAKSVIDGLGMLVGQAAESFNIWRKVMPEVEQVLLDLRADINKSD
ncbi:shikimate dehydrogenase [Thalassotalea sp. PLHSN55]|uniref:shikimate dehydrogenase n=1 Tax=Thalassotalea sp. PLHSN55 TaxID=3435888 RepID=UPI003F8594EA